MEVNLVAKKNILFEIQFHCARKLGMYSILCYKTHKRHIKGKDGHYEESNHNKNILFLRWSIYNAFGYRVVVMVCILFVRNTDVIEPKEV